MPDLSFKAFDKLSRTVGSGSSHSPEFDKKRKPGGGSPPEDGDGPDGGPGYAELQITSNFSFLRGASHPDELVLAAAVLGHRAIAITDRNSVAGIVRAYHAAKTVGIRLVVGVRLDLRDGTSLLAYPRDRAAYGRLTRLLTLGKGRTRKGECHLDYADVVAQGEGQIVIALPPEQSDIAIAAHAGRIAADFPGRAYLAAHHLYRGDDAARLAERAEVARQTGLPLVAVNDVLYHTPARRVLQDVVTCIREHCTIAEAGFRLAANAERHLKPAVEMARLFRGYEDALARGLEIVERCHFSLDELRYEYPEEPVPAGLTPHQHLTNLVWQSARERFAANPSPALRENGARWRESPVGEGMAAVPLTPTLSPSEEEGADPSFNCSTEAGIYRPAKPMSADGPSPRSGWEGDAGAAGDHSAIPAKIRERITHELALIAQLDFAPYFLTVHDIVTYARSQDILCQGRGSAANSVVCYCLGITSVDPEQIDVLFERFISAARNEPPDIDVDFEHERREEVIQYIYKRYGRDRAGIAATVICYRARGAIREVGKVLGLSGDVVAALAGIVWGWSNDGIADHRVREAGLDPADRNLRLALDLAAELIGFPRHLSQHVGGFVITRGPLSELVPIENAAMEDRTFIEWDKDDLDTLGILKIDVLALGMLTCIRKAFDLIERHYGRHYTLATVPTEQPQVYEMLSRADSVGVFQVESRAQMTMLPRLKPREFYDLVIEVAIVRPGPIQGNMVHPYLRRRSGKEQVEYPSPQLERVLKKTMGVPLFQEQAMQIAIVGAGFSPEDADRLRRAMATFKRNGDIHKFRELFIAGMLRNSYPAEFATRCFDQIEGFGTYGFPESHAASFALLVYVSAWIKCFYPDVFAAALLNSQPMGFYAPAQLVRDAREHGVEVRGPDINASEWDCTLEAFVPCRPCESRDPFGIPSNTARCAPPLSRFHLDLETAPSVGPYFRGDDKGRGLTAQTGAHELARELATDGSRQSPGWGIDETRWAMRLGFRQIKGLAEADAKKLAETRGAGYRDPEDLWRRSGLGRAALDRLAAADALRSLGLDRRQALWALKALGEPPLPLFAVNSTVKGASDYDKRAPSGSLSNPPPPLPRGGAGDNEQRAAALLPAMPLGEHVIEDYATTSLTIKRHPLAFLRGELRREGLVAAADLATLPVNRRCRIAGLVLIRQRPGSANGVVFVTIEDETGVANLIIWPPVLERFRRAALGATLLYCRGRLQREDRVIHLVADELQDWTPRLRTLRDRTGDEPPPAPPIRSTTRGKPEPGRQTPPTAERLPAYDSRDVVIWSRDFR